MREKSARNLHRTGRRTTSIAEALEQVAGENFDLIVLCHSLKQSDAVAICDAIRERKPPPLILKITRSFGYEEERAQLLCDALVDAHPVTLTKCARELLLRRSASKNSRAPHHGSTMRGLALRIAEAQSVLPTARRGAEMWFGLCASTEKELSRSLHFIDFKASTRRRSY